MFIKSFKKRFYKKHVLLNCSDSLIKKFLFFSKEKEKPYSIPENLSISFPGYPILKEETINSVAPNKTIEGEKNYFTVLNLYNKKFLDESKTCLIYENFIKKEKKNPYFLYNFDMYMQTNFNHIKNNFRNCSDINQTSNIKKPTNDNFQKNTFKASNNKIFNFYILKLLLRKKLFKLALFFSLAIFFIIKIISFFRIILNFIIIIIIAILLKLVQNNCNFFDKKLYLENYFQKNIENIFSDLIIFWNSIVRSSNLFSV
nr:hypothetical protein CcurKRNrm1_p072 [Cryptomonas curvata]